MKRVLFIAVALCLCASTAFANPSYLDQAAARSRARDHAGAIELYRKAYELDSNPALLVRIAHEYRRAGSRRDALAYFCSYIYVDAAGGLADEASTNARSIAAELGNPTDSDHEACATKPAAAAAPAPKLTPGGIDTIASDVLPQPPPRITKREVAGLILLGGSVASLGVALHQGQQVKEARQAMDLNAPGTDLAELERRENRADLRQKIFLGVGGAAMLTGGILYVLGRADRKRAERAYVAPTLTKQGGGGLVFGGAF